MNDRWVLRAMGCVLGAVGLASVGVGCAGSEGAAAPEKAARTSGALIDTDPVPPLAFPGQSASPPYPGPDCRAMAPTEIPFVSAVGPAWSYPETYVAFPATDTSDPHRTAYSHYFQYSDCTDSGSLQCQLENDFFSIPNGNGFKYKVAQLGYDVELKQVTQSADSWFAEGVNRVDEGYLLYPWNAGGNDIPPWCTADSTAGVPSRGDCSNTTAFFDTYAHPTDGTSAVGADWAQLWNLAWTYSYTPPTAPNPGPNNAQTKGIASEHHQCAFIYACPGGTQECREDSDCPSGQTCNPDLDDPGMTCWASCYDSKSGTFTADAHALVVQDFFVAMEKHDPNGKNW